MAQHLPIAVLIVAYAVRFGSLGVDVLHGFGQPAFDMGIPDQGVWLLSRFHDPFVTVMGRQLFGDHVSFIYVLLVPIYWVYPHTAALLVVQAMLLAGAAIPIYILGRHLLGSTVLATVAAAAYLLNPALQQGNMEQFHVECFEVAATATAICAAIMWRPRLLLVAVVVLLLCKEDAAMYALPLGVWVGFRRSRRWGASIVAASIVFALVDNLIVIPSLIGVGNIHVGRLPFGGPGGTISTLFSDPSQIISYVISDGRPFYVWQLAVSAGFVFLLAPEVAALALIGIAVNVWSDFYYQHQIEYHYSLTIVPILACGSVLALARMTDRRARYAATSVVAVAAVWACVIWGLAPFSEQHYPYLSANDPTVVATQQVIDRVPPRAVISAYYDYIPQLDHRVSVYMWPNPFVANNWGDLREEGQPLPFAKDVRYVVLPTQVAASDVNWQKVKGQFHLYYSNREAAIFERNGP
jgi:uncharacterized membrane protein